MSFLTSPYNHGGQIQAVSEKYSIPRSDWLDLSTGISPFVYPLPAVPSACWQSLPELEDGLEIAAERYYGSRFLLPVSGSQQAIYQLPQLRPARSKIGIIEPAYHSHQQAWGKAGHQVITLATDEVDARLGELDTLIVINPTNPTNPTALAHSRDQLLRWQQRLAEHQGWLIVDEAFIDTTPEHSLIQAQPIAGLIVLRSIGKFFGLAGIRLGFVWAAVKILQSLSDRQDNWAVSHPARWSGKVALNDHQWQRQQRALLPPLSQRLKQRLQHRFQTPVQHTALFAYFQHNDTDKIHQQLAAQGILTRYFETPSALRFGLPPNESAWQRLEANLESIRL